MPLRVANRNDIRAHDPGVRGLSTAGQPNDPTAFPCAWAGERRRYSRIDPSRRRSSTLRRALSTDCNSPGWPGPRAVLSSTTNTTAEPKIWSNHIGNRCRETPLHACEIVAPYPSRRSSSPPVRPNLPGTCTHTVVMHSHRLCSSRACTQGSELARRAST